MIGGIKMTNEEFQKIVLEELRSLKEGQKQLETGQKQLEVGQKQLEAGQRQLEAGQRQLETGQKQLEAGQKEIRKDLKAVIEQTADLTEFRQEANEKLDSLIEDNKSIHGILGEHEVSIRTLRRRVI